MYCKKFEKSTQRTERLNVAKDLKLTESGSEFHTLITRSTKNMCRTLLQHRDLYNLYLCPRVEQTVLSVKNSSKLTDT